MSRTILWIHGWGMSADVWRSAIHTYMPEYRHVFFSYAGCDTAADFHLRLQQILQQGEEPWILAGWSMGGMLAIEAAAAALAEHAGSDANANANANADATVDAEATATAAALQPRWQLERLVLIGTTLRFVSEDRSLGWPARIIKRMREQLQKNLQETLQQFRHSMFTAQEQEMSAVIKQLDQAQTDFSASALAEGLRYLQETDLSGIWPQCARLRPIWLHGAQDAICPQSAVPASSSAVATHIFSQAGHAPFLTQPDHFFAQLRGLLYEHS
ncbi:MAG: hypothetical protein A2201_05310 [Alicyclobacillus sp. RIFOXYA1_FULL_53_8]|nr:MAG: hypothetical protein A2201_05310 [Alicyclobacillus sp. RIFOXYA1_FULL_53_8]